MSEKTHEVSPLPGSQLDTLQAECADRPRQGQIGGHRRNTRSSGGIHLLHEVLPMKRFFAISSLLLLALSLSVSFAADWTSTLSVVVAGEGS